MKNKTADIIKTPVRFTDNAEIVCTKNVLFGHWYMYRKTFFTDEIPEKAVMLLLSADYSRVYINGTLCAEYNLRSYIFDKAYQAYDVLPFIRKGKNVVSVLVCETGRDGAWGFSCEVKTALDGAEKHISGEWKCRESNAIVPPMTYQLERSDVEIYDSGKETESWTDVNFNDSDWESAVTIGKLNGTQYKKLNQSIQPPHVRTPYKYERIAAVERVGRYNGYDICLSSCGSFCSAYMSEISCKNDSEMKIISTSGARGCSVDGKECAFGEDITLSAGKHTVAISAYYGGPALFQIRTDAELEFSNPLGGGWAFYHTERPKIPFRYPWNEPKCENPVPENLDIFMHAKSFSDLPDDIKSECEISQTGDVDLWHTLMTQKYISSPDGFCDKMLAGHSPRETGNEKTGVTLSGGTITVPAGEGEVGILLDYGREHIGHLSFETEAPAGTEIRFFCFEMLTESGIRYMGRNSAGKFMANGGKQTFVSNRRRGFRYAYLVVPQTTEEIKILNADVIETRAPAEPSGRFSCDDAELEKIYDISINTAKVCMLDSYVDCPGCEQNIWTGDARITALINMTNFGEREFDSRYLSLVGRSMDLEMGNTYRRGNPRYTSGNFLPCACFPTYPEGTIPIWSFSWILQVLDHYMHFGADENISQNLKDIETCFERCRALTNSRGLLEIDGAWNLIEWADNDLLPCGEVAANNMMLSACFSRAAEVYRSLGKNEKADGYKKSADDYRNAVNKYFWDDEKHAYTDSVRDEYAYKSYFRFSELKNRQPLGFEDFRALSRVSVQTNTLALLYDIVSGERAEYCKNILLDGVRDGNYISGTPANIIPDTNAKIAGIGSPYFLYFVLETLYKLGFDDIALNIIRRDWGKMTHDGFTTCIENFRGRNGEWGRSVAHAWSASPAIFLMTDVLGIKPVNPGYTEFSVVPKPSGLKRASGAVPTPYGNITVSWKIENGKLDIKCTAPAECNRIK